MKKIGVIYIYTHKIWVYFETIHNLAKISCGKCLSHLVSSNCTYENFPKKANFQQFHFKRNFHFYQ